VRFYAAARMTALRALIWNHRRLAAALLLLALVFRAAIPAGFMLSSPAGSAVTIAICGDASGMSKSMQMTIPAKQVGNGAGNGAGHEDSAQKSGPCAFSSLSQAMLGGADPIVLALAFAFILALGLAPASRLPFAQAYHLRPPLRGPPATA